MNHNIEYLNWTFTPDKIKEGNLYLAASLLASSLEVNSLLAVVECEDSSILDFERNTPLKYFTRPDRPMIFRVQSIKRAGPELYEITATSTLGLLSEGLHYGGIYTGQTARAVIADICGTVPFIVKSVLQEIKLYGWLPIAPPRDNLAQVLFALGAALKTDLDGVLRIEGLWDGISGTVTRDDMYAEAAVDYDGKVTQVIVTEHQYAPWTEEKQLFEGTAQAGDIITFDEPMHSLKADGFAIQASGANWARVSAGTGVLSGKTYIHNTRQISKDVWPAKEPNVKTVKEATLVSLVNSQACAQRLADYYRCRERVDAPVVYRGELPGDRLAAYHPFDKTGVDVCLESADITLSNTLKAQEKSLVGFVPKQIEQIVTYDRREMLTASGTWTVPEGVTQIRVVCIGGGPGGYSGGAGKNGGTTSRTRTGSDAYWNTKWARRDASVGGAGGVAGPGAATGGKIYSTTIDVTPGQKFQITIGQGGSGAPTNSSETPVAGSPGTATAFGPVSSESGASVESGFYDEVTGHIYGKKGSPGIAGGQGVGVDPDNESGEMELSPIKVPAGVGSWVPGQYQKNLTYKVVESGNVTDKVGELTTGWFVGLGGGAAQGANGGSSGADTRVGGDGATTPYAPAAASNPGDGGDGGYGGGGGGGFGAYVQTRFYSGQSGTLPTGSVSSGSVSTPGNGGRGGPGGRGASGCVILYYGVQKEEPHGQLVDKNNRMVLDRLGRRMIV